MSDRSRLVAHILQQVAAIGRDLAQPRSRPFGAQRLSRTQVDALFILTHSRVPVTSGRLAEALAVTPSAVTQLVSGLRDHGLAETVASGEDGRVRVIRLTPHARAQVEAFEKEAVDRMLRRFDALDDTELEQLGILLGAAGTGTTTTVQEE